MKLDDIIISEAIISTYTKDLLNFLDIDVAIAGAGPAGLVAAYYLAKKGKKVAIFEKKLSIGGGIWGGGIMMNYIVVQDDAKMILDEIGIKTKIYKSGYFIADSVETAAGLTFKARQAGAKIFNLISVEDVYLKENRVSGFVINWTAVEMSNLHVDPITIKAKTCIDATGHDASVVNVLVRKNKVKLNTENNQLVGEGGMWAEVGEAKIIENTREVFPGLWVAGMACNAVFGGPRMGPIFGGMLLSGKKVADSIK
ncbi:MAG: sulfide-dependent adenosine diphosphate thiazole synthase [Candidatus Helarchaeota archaeon]